MKSLPLTPFSSFEEQAKKYKTNNFIKTQTQKQNSEILKGVLLNNNIKKAQKDVDFLDYENNYLDFSPSLEKKEENKGDNKENKKEEGGFNFKKAFLPLALASAISVLTLFSLSAFLKTYSNHLAKDFEPLPGDLPRSMNLLEEPDLAIFRALRDPNAKNVLGLLGVALFSGLTLISKNFLDGFREIWTKKQECNINQNFQENMVSVEAEAFSGKLKVVDKMFKDTSKYFKETFSENNSKNSLSFKGENKEKEQKKKQTDKKSFLALLGASLGLLSIGALTFSNYKKTLVNLDKYKERMTHEEILGKIDSAVKNKDLGALENILKLINAKDETIKEQVLKIAPDEKTAQDTIERIKKSKIYAQAPEALAGVSEKIQYYCYVNEPRGHLYNWILNPENKFNKYLFLSLSTSSALGYVVSCALGAVKDVAVMRENSNSELDLRKKLVKTEIDNFKAKKESAINPMLENFKFQKEKGKSEEELKGLAEEILIEIKNGPPYVYS